MSSRKINEFFYKRKQKKIELVTRPADEKLGPLAFGFHDGQTEAPKIQAASVRDHYWGASLSKANAKGFIDAISDSSYSHPIDTSSKIHTMTSKSPVFVYHFGYR